MGAGTIKNIIIVCLVLMICGFLYKNYVNKGLSLCDRFCPEENFWDEEIPEKELLSFYNRNDNNDDSDYLSCGNRDISVHASKEKYTKSGATYCY